MCIPKAESKDRVLSSGQEKINFVQAWVYLVYLSLTSTSQAVGQWDGSVDWSASPQAWQLGLKHRCHKEAKKNRVLRVIFWPPHVGVHVHLHVHPPSSPTSPSTVFRANDQLHTQATLTFSSLYIWLGNYTGKTNQGLWAVMTIIIQDGKSHVKENPYTYPVQATAPILEYQ